MNIKPGFNRNEDSADQFAALAEAIRVMRDWPMFVSASEWTGELKPIEWRDACKALDDDIVGEQLIARFDVAARAFKKIAPSPQWQNALRIQSDFVNKELAPALSSQAQVSLAEIQDSGPRIVRALRNGWMRALEPDQPLPEMRFYFYSGTNPLENWRGHSVQSITYERSVCSFPDNSSRLAAGSRAVVKFLQHEYTHVIQARLVDDNNDAAVALLADILKGKQVPASATQTHVWDSLIFNIGWAMRGLGMRYMRYPDPGDFNSNTKLGASVRRIYRAIPHEAASFASEAVLVPKSSAPTKTLTL